MARIGTAFVEIKPDLSAFAGSALRPKIEAEVAAATAGLGGDIHKEVKVDVDRSSLSRLQSSVSSAFRGVAAGVGGLLGNLPVIGGLFQGLTSSFGTTAIGAGAATAAILALAGVLAGLAASLGAAIAGLGALTVAFAAALGPAVVVTIAAFVRFAEIIKAVKDHQSNAGTEARGLAGSQLQLGAATDAVSQAQVNLKEQTTAAYAAWADSIENVKDDLLGIKDAKLGIDDATLSTREAKQALADYRKELGAGGGAFGDVFKKFTDVNVDTSGLRGALQAAAKSRGTSLSNDQELHLERLILNLRKAKLNEAHATDTLHDANTKLKADRKTEVDFAKRGIAAYKPYREATHQLASAQRSLAAAQNTVTGAAAKQSKAWDDLTPAEKNFGKVLIKLGDTFKRIFIPVMAALLPGVTKGLETFAKAADDPRIKGGLVATGRALGGAFASLAKTLTSPEMRRAFAQFAAVGVKVIKGFGTKVFSDLALVLTRLATATLPLLIPFLDRVASWFDGLEHSSRNTKNLRDDVKHVVDVFNDWVTLIGKTATALLDIGKFLEPIGTAIVKFLTNPIKNTAKAVGLGKDELKKFRKAFDPVFQAAKEAFGGIVDQFKGVAKIVRGVMRVVVGVLTGDFGEAWKGIKDIFSGGVKFIKGSLRLLIAPVHLLGKKIFGGLKSAFNSVVKFVTARVNDLIGAFNALPGPDLPFVGVHDVNNKTTDSLKKFGDAVTKKERHPKPVTVHHRPTKPSFHDSITGHASSYRPVTNNIVISTPEGALPDGRFVGQQIATELARRG